MATFLLIMLSLQSLHA